MCNKFKLICTMEARMEEYGSTRLFGNAVDEMMDGLVHSLHTVIDDLKLKLYDELTEYERQNIDGSRTNMDKVTTFFTILKTKSVDTHQKCLRALEELKHKDVADKLRERMESACLLRTAPSKLNIAYSIIND